MKAIDPKQIKSWQDFEFLLSLIVENRILKVFVGHLCKTQQILGLDEEKDEGLKVGKKRQKRLNRKLRKLQAFTDDETKSVKSYFDSPVGKGEREDEPVLTNFALKQLPTASIYDKLLLARKFDKDKFLLDFSSSGGTSDYSDFSLHSTRQSTALKQE